MTVDLFFFIRYCAYLLHLQTSNGLWTQQQGLKSTTTTHKIVINRNIQLSPKFILELHQFGLIFFCWFNNTLFYM